MYSIKELRKKSRSELLGLISELKGRLLALRFESATGQLRELHLIKTTKQDIARIFTVLNEKQTTDKEVEKKPLQKGKTIKSTQTKEKFVTKKLATKDTGNAKEV